MKNDAKTHKGIICPRCQMDALIVLYTRKISGGKLRRRRKCKNCGHKFTTHES